MNVKTAIGLSGGLVFAAALAGCATVEETLVERTAETYNATLTGAQIVGGGGDPDGFATAQVSISDRLDQICYDVNNMRDLGEITAIRVHRGAAGVSGPAVWTLDKAGEGGWKGCTEKPDWLHVAVTNWFTTYYVNIETTDYPGGAIRGQLGQ